MECSDGSESKRWRAERNDGAIRKRIADGKDLAVEGWYGRSSHAAVRSVQVRQSRQGTVSPVQSRRFGARQSRRVLFWRDAFWPVQAGNGSRGEARRGQSRTGAASPAVILFAGDVSASPAFLPL